MEDSPTQTVTCLRCGHSWLRRPGTVARVCPKCRSALWRTPSTEKTIATPCRDMIIALKKEYRLKTDDLLALTEKNDPYYMGSDLECQKAQWFLDLWIAQGCQKGMHLRRMHYRHVSQPSPVKADATAYQNTHEDWKYLCDCSKIARALRLVEAADFDDHRNPDPYLVEWTRADNTEPLIGMPALTDTFSLPEITSGLSGDFGLGSNLEVGSGLNERPYAFGYDHDSYLDRPYLLEIWIEKTTMNDIILPICQELHINLIPAAGTQSVTNAIRLLERCRRHDKPARVFYISDFDPGGQNMPMAVARTLEFYSLQYPHKREIKLTPLVLTEAQAEGLPRTPIKPTDRRRGNFEALYGEGAVELDALEALRPGELETIIREAVTPYIDRTIRSRLLHAEDKADEMLSEQWQAYTEEIRGELAVVSQEIESIAKKYREQMSKLAEQLREELEPFKERLEPLHQRLTEAHESFTPELPTRPQPEITLPDESEWLFDSSREYMAQLAYYKQRKNGKPSRNE